jgi:hypothetical protein
MSGGDLFVVEVREEIAEALTYHEGHMYVSPPQDRERALELVALVLGYPVWPNGNGECVWRHAIAGGQRSVRLRPAWSAAGSRPG